MTAPRQLLVIGGSGFLGSQICRVAVDRGYAVTSLSRSPPKWMNNTPPSWASKINYVQGDVCDPSTYKAHLAKSTAVVYSVGILFESDYKGYVNGQKGLLCGLKDAVSYFAGSASPLSRGNPSAARTPSPAQQAPTYELLHRDAALAAAKAASEHTDVKTFVYISAAECFPTVPARYITTKREAEVELAKITSFRSVYLRPGFMFDTSRKISMPLAGVFTAVSSLNQLAKGALPFVGGAGVKPLEVADVAEAAVQAIEDEDVKGAVDVAGIERLHEKSWRGQLL
ncbi:hypothetical protein YB2330_001370 [Saitoella coloradoensis]